METNIVEARELIQAGQRVKRPFPYVQEGGNPPPSFLLTEYNSVDVLLTDLNEVVRGKRLLFKP